MIKSMLVTIALLSIVGTAVAEPSKETGFYLVAAGGRSIYDEGGSIGSFGDDSDSSSHFAAGYKFLKYFAVEARFADFGKFEVNFDDFDVEAQSVHAVGIVPFGPSGWEFFGQVGLGTVKRRFRGIGGVDDSAMAGGIGFRWYPMPQLAIAVQTDVYVWDDNNDWESSVGANQFSVQFIF
jgi:OOP family OmpA-OmpF porin